MTFLPRRPFRFLQSLRHDRSGIALLEFAIALPVVITIGAYGLEIANLAIVNMRVSQIALTLADNASRVGALSSLSTQQLREIDINDVLQAAKTQGTAIALSTQGRVTLSSLENVKQSYDASPVQRIHWQRCFGAKSGTDYDSSYGNAKVADGSDASATNAGPTVKDGMGPANSPVTAPAGSGVMFVEVNYLTKPLFKSWLMAPKRIRYAASFLVRDRRDFSQIFDPVPKATNKRTCDLYVG